MDNLQPLYVRLRASTIEALKAAQADSPHRSIASFVDALLRGQLIDERADNLQRLIANARQTDAAQQ